MTIKEFKVQLALGTLTPLYLFLQMLSMQNRVANEGWDDNRNPVITTQDDGDIHIEINDYIVFVFNSEEEYMGTFNYSQ